MSDDGSWMESEGVFGKSDGRDDFSLGLFIEFLRAELEPLPALFSSQRGIERNLDKMTKGAFERGQPFE
ncbi:MAG TPA: hypothetical protein VHO25_16945 [Polyangiaceae bacterium]|nr:hypothetical protein [Polyangiaceae bacterium]